MGWGLPYHFAKIKFATEDTNIFIKYNVRDSQPIF